MERFIADLVKKFEGGGLNRREFCETVALAATVYAAGDAANAQTTSGFKHLGMQSTPGKDSGSRANLMFGPEPGKGGTFLAVRNRNPSATPRPQPTAVIDHV